MIFLSFSDFPRDPWVLCVVFCPCGAKRHRKSWGKCDFFSISKGRAAWVFEVWRGEDRQILPPPVYGKHNGVMPFGLQNMSLRGAKRRGNPFPFPVYGFPRQCEHWLGMTGLAESSAPTLLSRLLSRLCASRPVLGPTHCGAGPFSGASVSFSPRAPLSPAAPALFSPGCTGPC